MGHVGVQGGFPVSFLEIPLVQGINVLVLSFRGVLSVGVVDVIAVFRGKIAVDN